MYIHTSCVRAAKALASPRICAYAPGPSLLTDIRTEISCILPYWIDVLACYILIVNVLG